MQRGILTNIKLDIELMQILKKGKVFTNYVILFVVKV